MEKILDRIAADLILIIPDDMQALAGLHEAFSQLSIQADEISPTASVVAQSCANHVEKIILREVDDPESILKMLNGAVTGLQGIIRDKREPEEVSFPTAILNLSVKEDTPEADLPGEPMPEEPAAECNSLGENDLRLSLEGNDSSLVAEFISEAEEHCATAEQMLMDLETDPRNKEAIDAIFRSFHTIKGAAGFMELTPISMLAHESETLLDLARQETVIIADRIADAVFESIDAMRALLKGVEEVLNDGGSFDSADIVSEHVSQLRQLIAKAGNGDDDDMFEDNTPQRVGDKLVEMGAVSQREIEEALKHKKSSDEKIGETLVRQGKVTAKAVVHALRDQKGKTVGTAVKEMVKIDTERLDKLVDTIGEMVIAESMVGQDEEILALASTKVNKNISHLNKITRELQEMGMAMRLVPIQATFRKLARAVRDLARKSGKQVDLKLSGEDAEVDRSIVENIGDPLMHMIRNSLDHGLETSTERMASGKTKAGTVWIRAFHKGGNIYLEIEDDGKGLDKEKIMAKAKEKGLLANNKDLTDREIYNLIMLPGFSTASKVTDISGRGVGMDVVKKNIEAMRGHLEIDSEPGKGTKFSMRLPLTLAIIDGMLVGIGKEQLIIPTLSVVKSLPVSPDMIHTVNGLHEMITLRGEVIPLHRIRRLFGLPFSSKDDVDSTVVIVEDMERKIGLVVDHLYGQRQTVIKNLGPLFQNKKWIAGGAILANGNVGLIIDISGISEMAKTFTFDQNAKGTSVSEGLDISIDTEIDKDESTIVSSQEDLYPMTV
ncbi:MAG: chemotaxis protein CheA [FCB group bacterium]|nr:chemotaxis protein CheA [FCB group bacterium]